MIKITNLIQDNLLKKNNGIRLNFNLLKLTY